MNLSIKNWKTTLAGTVTMIAGFVTFSPSLFSTHPWVVEVSKYVMAGGLGAMGIFGKDKDVTGGTRPQ